MPTLVHEGEGRWSLAGNADIHEATELHAGCVSLVERVGQEGLTLDLGRMVTLDTAGMQVLIALRRQIGPQRCRLTACPGALRGLVRSLGLEDELFGGA